MTLPEGITNFLWLVVWNMTFIFPYIGNNPDELIFFRGVAIRPTSGRVPRERSNQRDPSLSQVAAVEVRFLVAVNGGPRLGGSDTCRRCLIG